MIYSCYITPVKLIEMHFVRRFATGCAEKIGETGVWLRMRYTRPRDGAAVCENTRVIQTRNLRYFHTSSCSGLHEHALRLDMDQERKTDSCQTTLVAPRKFSANHYTHAQKYIRGMPGKQVRGKIQQTQRRYYTPRSLTQQAIDVQEETLTGNPNLRILTQENQYVSSAFQLPVSRDLESTRRELLRRPLGGIEKMYNMYTSHGTDIICLMTKIETVYPVTPSAVQKALLLLHQRHPLLRMSIKGNQNSEDGSLDFVEMEDSPCDFSVLEGTDWLQYTLDELENPFNGTSQSLIRYRMLNATAISDVNKHPGFETKKVEVPATGSIENTDFPNFSYQATFIFIMHHSIMDGGYSLWIFQEFVNFLDAVAMEMDIRGVKELPLLSPFEDIFTFSCNRSETKYAKLKNNAHSLSFCHNSTNDTVLQAYNKAFQNDIDISSNKQLGNGCLVFKFSKEKTKTFFQTTKSHNCSPKGAISAACVLALLELVYGNKYSDMFGSFAIPVEYMADFRRIGDFRMPDSVPHYPGVAALHIPLLAEVHFVDKNPVGGAFWTIAENFGESLDKNIDSPEVYDWIKAEASKYNKCPPKPEVPGKSPYVLSISNMGKCDGVLHTDVSDRVRLTDLHGHSNILVDDMPLFCVTTFALNGHFCGNVSFCTNYTSYETATRYVGLIHKYLCSPSKL